MQTPRADTPTHCVRTKSTGSGAVFTDLLGQMLQQVLSQAEVGQVGEVADAAGQRGQLIVGEHQFLCGRRWGEDDIPGHVNETFRVAWHYVFRRTTSLRLQGRPERLVS